MEKDALKDFYERIYFHEVEVKERIALKAQMLFTLIFVSYSIFAYMVRTLDYSESLGLRVWFYLLLLVFIFFSIFSVHYAIRCFWGNEYSVLPFSSDIEKYRMELDQHRLDIEEYNKKYPENAQAIPQTGVQLDNFLKDKIISCASHNAELNEIRSVYAYWSFKWLLIMSVPLSLAAAMFIFFDLDTASPRKDSYRMDRNLAKEVREVSRSIETLNLTLKSMNREVKNE